MPVDGAIRAAVFDLDGTLVNSRADITQSVNHALEGVGLPPLSEDEIGAHVGRGVTNLVRSVLGESHQDLFKKALARFKKHYSEHLLDHTALYPGVADTLERLSGLKKAVLTNKPTEYSVRILRGLRVERYFDSVLGGDALPVKKPAPDALLLLAARFGLRPEEILMVGDSAIDVEAGKNAGVRTCAVTYGFGTRAELEAAGADCLVGHFGELARLCRAPGEA
ncbi:MAG: HAD-IA family hydrolase [Candidatus Omnitrophica bacterium]|nr:HAD-IA family hydrolase [Candidatus Omnitrophota bacterium]